jgi:hypothetical protein
MSRRAAAATRPAWSASPQPKSSTVESGDGTWRVIKSAMVR